MAWPPLRTLPDEQLRARRGQRPRRRQPVRRLRRSRAVCSAHARSARGLAARRHAMICLVTDRRRLVAGDAAGAQRALPRRAGPPRGGRRRRSDPGPRARSRSWRAGRPRRPNCSPSRAGTPTRIVVNDRLDVALACGADGVHLRGDSIPVGAARQLAPAGLSDRAIGPSAWTRPSRPPTPII